MGPKRQPRSKKARAEDENRSEDEMQVDNENEGLGRPGEPQASKSRNEDEHQPGPSTSRSPYQRPSRAAARKATESNKRLARLSLPVPPVKTSRSRAKRSYSIGPVLPPWPSRGILTGPVRVLPAHKPTRSTLESGNASTSQGETSARRENGDTEMNSIGSDREADGTLGQSMDFLACFPKGVRPAKISHRRTAVRRLSLEGCSSARTPGKSQEIAPPESPGTPGRRPQLPEFKLDTQSSSASVSNEKGASVPSASESRSEEPDCDETSGESSDHREF